MSINNPSGRPRNPDSNISRVRQYFLDDASEDDFLDYDDIQVKFNLTRKAVFSVVQKLKDQGICETRLIIRRVKS